MGSIAGRPASWCPDACWAARVQQAAASSQRPESCARVRVGVAAHEVMIGLGASDPAAAE